MERRVPTPGWRRRSNALGVFLQLSRYDLNAAAPSAQAVRGVAIARKNNFLFQHASTPGQLTDAMGSDRPGACPVQVPTASHQYGDELRTAAKASPAPLQSATEATHIRTPPNDVCSVRQRA